MQTNTKEKKSVARIVMITMVTMMAVLFCGYVGMSVYYRMHFYPNTTIGGVEASGMTATEVEAQITEGIQSYQLTLLERSGRQETIAGADVDLRPDYGTMLEEALDKQTGFEWPKYFFTTYEIDEQPLTFDTDKLRGEIEQLSCADETTHFPSEDAFLQYSDGAYNIVPEVYGTALKQETLLSVVEDAIFRLDAEVDLEAEHCYVDPVLLSEDETLVGAAQKANDYLKTSVTYIGGEKQISCDSDTIADMLIISPDGDVALDEDKLADFVHTLAETFNTCGITKNFMTHYGVEVKITRGDYGYIVDEEAEIAALKEAFVNQTVQEREPIYTQAGASYGLYDYGDTYVEINLTAQHLFVYEKGQMVFETDFVSGSELNNTATRLGMSRLKYKERDATLKGATYESFVHYWMPFDGGIGLHDATWRSRFGGSIYKTNGSHGCINLPLSAAEKIFSMVHVGEPMVVYKLPGTEPPDDKTDKIQDSGKKDTKKDKQTSKKESDKKKKNSSNSKKDKDTGKSGNTGGGSNAPKDPVEDPEDPEGEDDEDEDHDGNDTGDEDWSGQS